MLFGTNHRSQSDAKRHYYAIIELIYTAVDFGAAVCFVVGSVLFFYDSLQHAGTWLFLIGSILFAAKPVIRLWREIRLAAMGDETDLAKRAGANLDD